MTFVVVGGGPTGVEMAGAIAELAKRALASDFQSIDRFVQPLFLSKLGPGYSPRSFHRYRMLRDVRSRSLASKFASG